MVVVVVTAIVGSGGRGCGGDLCCSVQFVLRAAIEGGREGGGGVKECTMRRGVICVFSFLPPPLPGDRRGQE
jgi:hypothetical protein